MTRAKVPLSRSWPHWYDYAQLLERELIEATDKLADAHARISSDLIARQFLVDENNKWRECANKLAAINLQTVPLICLEPEERVALSTLENLNRSAAMPNEKS